MTQCYNVTLLQREGHCNLEYAQTKLNIKLLLNLDQHLQQSQQVRKCMHRITSLPRSIAFVIHSKTAILRNCIWISNNVCIVSPSQLQVQAFFCSDKYLADDASDASKKKMHVSVYVICYWCQISPKNCKISTGFRKFVKVKFHAIPLSDYQVLYERADRSEADNRCIFATFLCELPPKLPARRVHTPHHSPNLVQHS